MPSDTTVAPRLLISAREAAAMLSVSEKHLWSNSTPRGPIPAVKIGNRVLYSPRDLEAWVARASQGVDAAASQQ